MDCDRCYCCCKASPIGFKAKKSSPLGSNFYGNLKNKIKGFFSSSSSDEEDDNDIIINKSSNKNSSSNNFKSNDSNNNNEVNYTDLIMSQDVIEGSWNENNETKKLINKITSEVFDKIKNKIISLKKGENENKIIYTILVIYFLKTKCTQNLNEYRLVINKANKFLAKNGINYDDIVSSI